MLRKLLIMLALSIPWSTFAHLTVTPWTNARVDKHKQEIVSTMRKRAYIRYATAAALCTGLAYVLTGPHGSAPAVEPYDSTAMITRKELDDMYKKLSPDWLTWYPLGGGISVPMLGYDKAVSVANYLVTTGLFSTVAMGVTHVCGFRDDIAWFYGQASVASAYTEVREFALSVERDPSSEIKKNILLTSTHNYQECLLSLVAFMRYRAEQLVPDASIRCTLAAEKTIIPGLELFAIEFFQKIDTLLATGFKDGEPQPKYVEALLQSMNAQVLSFVEQFRRFERSHKRDVVSKLLG